MDAAYRRLETLIFEGAQLSAVRSALESRPPEARGLARAVPGAIRSGTRSAYRASDSAELARSRAAEKADRGDADDSDEGDK